MYKSILFMALLIIVVMPSFAQNVQIDYSEKINTDVPTHSRARQKRCLQVTVD